MNKWMYGYRRLKKENEELKEGILLLTYEVEHLNKMFCVGCGACGTESQYAECTCEGEGE